nr:hypothetical protein [Halolamina sp. CBA1230]
MNPDLVQEVRHRRQDHFRIVTEFVGTVLALRIPLVALNRVDHTEPLDLAKEVPDAPKCPRVVMGDIAEFLIPLVNCLGVKPPRLLPTD